MPDPLRDLAEAAGVALRYHDSTRTERHAGPDTLRAVLAALDLPAGTDAEAAGTLAALREEERARRVPLWQVVDTGPFRPGLDDWSLADEAGAVQEGGAQAEARLDPGYHHLQSGGETGLVLAVPPRPPLPERRWGVTLPLYGLRPPQRGGIGDYADLARAVRAMGQHGADFVGVNPIHAGFPEDPHAVSPYSPSHRRRLNVLHIATREEVEGDGDLIDYARAVPARKAALERDFAAFEAGGEDPALAAWAREEGAGLRRFAVHQALSERHGPYWSNWPEELRDPVSPAVADFCGGSERRIAYHTFLQWRAAGQLRAVARAADGAGMAYGLYLDLAVGTHPHGAETWAEPAAFARGVSLGAPPDAFSAEGQDWGLAPLSPRSLEREGFRPLIETLRTQLRYAHLLRIDHILGFERAFWVPQGLPGTYVRMPKAAMLAVARIEAHRAGATIVGEDLGNVPEGLQRDLAEAGLLGCRVAMFERDGDTFRDPKEWEPRALASFGTHDLPTFAGWRTGRELEWREAVGDMQAPAVAEAQEDRRDEVAAFEQAAGGTGSEAMHLHVGRAASVLVALQIEDILGLAEQPNLPGTIDQHPNWRRRLPLGPEELASSPEVARAAAIMRNAGR